MTLICSRKCKSSLLYHGCEVNVRSQQTGRNCWGILSSVGCWTNSDIGYIFLLLLETFSTVSFAFACVTFTPLSKFLRILNLNIFYPEPLLHSTYVWLTEICMNFQIVKFMRCSHCARILKFVDFFEYSTIAAEISILTYPPCCERSWYNTFHS